MNPATFPEPEKAALYHECGHVLVCSREGALSGGIELFDPASGFTAMHNMSWIGTDLKPFQPTLAQLVRVDIAGLHAQAIYAPDSLSKRVLNAMEYSMFVGPWHPKFGHLSAQDLDDLALARDDIAHVWLWMRQKRSNKPGAHSYLRRREREVREFLSVRQSRSRADRILLAVYDWLTNGGPQKRNRPGPRGGYTMCPASVYESELYY